MEDTYKNEHTIWQHAAEILDRKDLTPEQLWTEYAGLMEQYKNLLDLSIKITRIGDRYQKKAIDANNALKKSEQKLRELNATKDTFFSIIAHDLKNPLTIIMGFSDLLVNAWETMSEEDRRAQIQQIRDASGNLYKLLTNLLDWARLQTGSIQFTPEEQTINPLIKETVALLEPGAGAKGVTIRTDLEEELIIPMDQDMIRTVIRNLISNAIKFTSSHDTIVVSGKRYGNSIEIMVEDSGVGISEENLAKLFRIDAHHSTKGTANEQGTGLGLILCKEFIEKHKGSIRVESEKGKGSRFIIHLPVSGGVE
jgi:signal transduction histidine kinase